MVFSATRPVAPRCVGSNARNSTTMLCRSFRLGAVIRLTSYLATRLGVAVTFAAAAATVAFAQAAAPQPSCVGPADLVRLDVPLKRTAQRIASGLPLTIVAIGSSSTAGAGASSPANSYPSRLAVELQQHFPRVPVTVHQPRDRRRDVARDAGALRPRRVRGKSRSGDLAGRQQFGVARSAARRHTHAAAARPGPAEGGRRRYRFDESAVRAQGDRQARRRRHGRSDRPDRQAGERRRCSSASR